MSLPGECSVRLHQRCVEAVFRLSRLRHFLSFYSKFLLSRYENHVRLEIDMPSQEDMDLCTDKVLSKGRILQELTKAVKLVSAVCFNIGTTYQGHTLSIYIHMRFPNANFDIYTKLTTFSYFPVKLFLNDLDRFSFLFPRR